ncbi:hypothetical protein GCM10027299_21840 [Larkinella ripae]
MLQLTKTFDSPCSIKDADPKKGIVTGYFACFGNKDSDGDIIVKGAFAKTIAENGPSSTQPRIKHLLDHNTRQAIGKLTLLKEDDFGLYYESQIGSHALGVDFVKMAESGIITEHSIGYRVIDGKGVDLPDNNHAYQLLEIKLFEGSSLQFWGANPNTPLLGVKSAADLLALLSALEKALKNGDYTDETFKTIQSNYDQIGAILKERTTKPGGQTDTTSPDAKQYTDLIDSIKSNNLFTLNLS